MKRRLLLLVVAIIVIASVLGARYIRARSSMGSSVPIDSRFVSANTDFAIRLFNKEFALQPGKNVVISPLGVSMVLSLAYNGAQGDTKTAMGKTLGLNGMSLQKINESSAALLANLNNPGTGVELAAANAIWADRRAPIVPRFVEIAKNFYDAESVNLNLSDPDSADVINRWVREKTNGRIDDIVEGLDKYSVLCITNAMYFKGTWACRFDKNKTVDARFHLGDGKEIKVPLMYQKDKFRYYYTDTFDAVALPYGSGRISMYVFVPNRISTLPAFFKTLNNKNWEKWISEFRETEISVRLPRWKIEYQTNLKEACTRLGMGIAFKSGKANFRGLCRSRKDAYIDVLKQKAFIEVNEEGTEAAAATYALFAVKSLPPEIRADRPFFYAIRDDRTGEILFMGTVVDPSEGSSE